MMDFNPMELFKQLQQMQGKVGELQERLKGLRVTGSAGGDMVRIEMDGQFAVLDVTISPEAVDPGEIGMLQDLIRAAFSDALVKMREKIRSEVSGLAGGLQMPPGLFGV